MQFHPTGTLPPDEVIVLCRNARFNLLILLVLFWAIPVVWHWAGITWLAYACAALAALLSLPMLKTWRVRGLSSNWVLALVPDGLWLNLRDGDFDDVEPGQTVLFLPYDQVLAARKTLHRYKTPSSDGDVSHKDSYLDLDIQIAASEAQHLRSELQAERQRPRPGRSYFGGFITVRSGNIRTQPIDFVEDGLLRIKFSAGNYGLRPRLEHVLALLPDHVLVESGMLHASPDVGEASETDYSALLRKLVVEGRMIDATKLVQDRTGKTLTEARAFVAELSRQIA